VASAQPKGLPKAQHDLVRRTYSVVLGKPVGFAYLASTVGVVAVDISDQANPRYVGVLPLPDSVNSLAWVRGKLVAAIGPSGIVVVDVQDPSKPKKVGAIKLAGSAMGVAAHGSYALVASGTAGLHVVGIEDPARPRRVAHLDTPGYARSVRVSGDRVFLGDGRAGAHLFKLAGHRLVPLSRINTKGHVYDLAVNPDGTELVVAEGHAGISRYDLRAPKKPRITGRLSVQDTARGVAMDKGRLAVADGTKGLAVVERSGKALREVGRYTPERSVNSVVLIGNLAFVANDYDGLLILKISPAGKPALAGSLPPRKK
jgi:hypothetical protein